MAANGEVERSITMLMDERRLSCRVRIEPAVNHDGLTVDEIVAFLDIKGISRSAVDREAIAGLVEIARASPETSHEAAVANGSPPVDGDDARFELSPDIQGQFDDIEHRKKALRRKPGWGDRDEPNNDPSADDPVDFYNLSAFVIVQAGARVATIHPATAGTAGFDVQGEAVAARDGKPLPLTIGNGLQTTPNREVVATVEGRLLLTPTTVCVDDTLNIDGNIDFSTGNIDFPGDVAVAGGVRDRFVVKSKGSVHVNELIEAANIQTEGDLIIETGMAGREIGSLHVGGRLQAIYLDGVRGIVDGSCDITREISNCDLELRGSLESPGCVVRGGRIEVARRVDVGQLGGTGGVHTELSVGCARELESSAVEIADLIRELESADETLAKLADMQQVLKMGLDRLEATYARATLVSLTVRRAIHPGVRLLFPGYTAQFRTTLDGPIVIDLGNHGRPQCAPMGSSNAVPLSKVAHVTPSNERGNLREARERLGAIFA